MADSLIMPFAFAWRELDWNLRWYQVSIPFSSAAWGVYLSLHQPYVVLQKGNAVAEESLLLDYVRPSSTSEITLVDLVPDLVRVC
jgi:hypothetical protein